MDSFNPFLELAGKLHSLIDNRSALVQILERLESNIAKEQFTMSQITDWAQKEQADLSAISATLNNLVTGIDALNKLIESFQNSPGTLSPEDQAALDGIQSASQALVAQSAAISTAPPSPTPSPVVNPMAKR